MREAEFCIAFFIIWIAGTFIGSMGIAAVYGYQGRKWDLEENSIQSELVVKVVLWPFVFICAVLWKCAATFNYLGSIAGGQVARNK